MTRQEQIAVRQQSAKELRDEKFSVTDIAEHLGVSRKTVWRDLGGIEKREQNKQQSLSLATVSNEDNDTLR